jgi:hypothetical protein
MNLYFLVEGKSSERKLYPAWLSYLLPELQKVSSYDQVDTKNYYLISGEGYPSIIYKFIPASIEEIHLSGKYQYFVVCLDAEEQTVTSVKNEIYTFLNSEPEKYDLRTTKLVLIIQNRCLETWFLGNKRVFSRQPQSPILLEYMRHYNVSVDDPELMPKYSSFNTHAQFHFEYLKAIFSEKKICYSKKNPGEALQQYYLQQLIARINQDPNHLETFRYFISFCNTIKHEIQLEVGS